MSSLTALLACVLTLAAPQPPEELRAAELWKDFTLPNGATLSVMPAPLAESQAFYLVLPLGFVLDGPGEVQWAHVLEHVLLRAVDPDHDLVTTQGLRVAAETTQSSLRLEVYAPPERWESALQLLADWLSVAEVDATSLALEKSRITQELVARAPSGQTHKWAAAAWNQAVRHGAEHVRVSGALAELSAERVSQELLPRMQLGPGAHLLSVGPADTELVMQRVRDSLGVMTRGASSAPAPSADPEAARDVRGRIVTWDISSRHYIEAFLLPDESAAERVAADTLALLASQRVAQTPSLEQRGFRVSVAVDHLTPEGRWFVLSSPLPQGQSLETLRTAFRQLLTSIQGAPETPIALDAMRQDLTVWPDFPALRREHAGNPQLREVEMRQALFLFYAQLNMGLSLESLVEVYATLDREVVDALARRLFRETNRSSLLLKPRD
ncbi:MAG: hypothetical protein DHS20C15_09020 [Planctomycetota bacterium]|nr:MAG: hypothetical protein DHS20C15_09020 [Planctomycetota bacterium]